MKKKVWLPTIIMFFFGVLFLMPIILLVMNAFKTHNDMIQNFLSFPHYLYTGNFTEAIERLKFWKVVGNSAYVTLGTMLVCTIISFMAAYGIAHIPGKLGNVLYLLFTLGQIIPFHSIMIALSVQLTNANLLNNLTVLIFLYAGFHGAFGIFTYVGFLKSIPKELEEAAAIDGCGMFRCMWQVIFPLVRSTSITLLVLFFLWTWNDFLMPNLYVSDSGLRTLTVAIYMFKSTSGSEWNLMLAGMTLSMVPIVIIYIAAQKYITSGLTAGAVKM